MSIGAPPAFSIEHFDTWKIRMKAYLASIHDEMQDVITTGPIIPQNPNPAYNVTLASMTSKTLDITKDEYEGDDKKRANLDAVCKNLFFQSLVMSRFIG